jgi:cyclopropane fatty-acyl-phospholipid synthase-like methyltransferase
MLDPIKVKDFWEKRADTFQTVAFESIANLEQDPEYLKLKIKDETEKVFGWLPDIKGKRILDLGAGVGQWSFRFSARMAGLVTAVEFTKSLANIGIEEIRRRQCTNVEFIVSLAEQFHSNETYDIIFISGLFVYLNDDQAEALIAKLPSLCHPDTIVLLRDGVGVASRYEINNRFSEHLQAYYSATYRTREQYQALFEHAGFVLNRTENMFPDGHPLNKYPETRLCLYLFKRT